MGGTLCFYPAATDHLLNLYMTESLSLHLVPNLNSKYPVEPQGNVFQSKCELLFYQKP